MEIQFEQSFLDEYGTEDGQQPDSLRFPVEPQLMTSSAQFRRIGLVEQFSDRLATFKVPV